MPTDKEPVAVVRPYVDPDGGVTPTLLWVRVFGKWDVFARIGFCQQHPGGKLYKSAGVDWRFCHWYCAEADHFPCQHPNSEKECQHLVKE